MYEELTIEISNFQSISLIPSDEDKHIHDGKIS